MVDVDADAFRQFAQGVVSYIRTTQPLLEKAAAYQKEVREYQKKVAHVVDALVKKGRVSIADGISLYNELRESPIKAATLLVQLSDQVGTVPLGGPSDLKDLDTRDAIERFALDHHS